MAFSKAQDFSITDTSFNEVHRDYNHQEISSNPQTLNIGSSNSTPHIPLSHPEQGATARYDLKDQRSSVISSPIAAYGSNVGGNQTNNVYNYFTFSPSAYQANPPSVSAAKEPKHPQNIDISATLDTQVKLRREELNWRQSIVDLMKILRLDPGKEARKKLALGAGYDGDMDDSRAMNIWLHSYVKDVVAAVGCDLSAAREVLQRMANSANVTQPPEEVDISTVLDNAVELRREKLNWRESIYDLMKVLRLDPSIEARKRLAHGVRYDGDMTDSKTMNIWLLSYVKGLVTAVGGDLTAARNILLQEMS